MRVSSADFFTNSLASMQRSDSLVAQVQRQLGSGLKLENPIDDPAGAASVSRANAALAAGASYDTAVQHANAALQAEEGALSSVNDVLQRVRELTINGLSASQSTQSRAGIATEVQALRGQLLSIANTVGPTGEYLFGGYSVSAPPFNDTGSGVSFVGDAGQRRLDIGAGNSIAIADAGSAVFAGARGGNGTFVTATATANTGSLAVGTTSVVGSFVPDDYTVTFNVDAAGAITYAVTGAVSGAVASGSYTPGATLSFNGVTLATTGTPAAGDTLTVKPAAQQGVFAVLDEIASALSLPDGTAAQGAAQTNRLTRALENLDQQMGQVSSVRADVGSRMKAADVASDANAGSKLQIQQALSSVQDLDYAEASTRLAKNLTSLQAVQQTFSRLSNLSLFNYLR